MSVQASDLAGLYPLDSVREEHLQYLAAEVARAASHDKGEVLFSAGEEDEDTMYVVDGQVRCEYPDGRSKTHEGGSLQGRYALGDSRPRRFTAVVESKRARVLHFDRRHLEKILTWDQLSRSENFRHFDSSPQANRWVFRLLQCRAMHKLPSANIERMFQRFEEIEVKEGEVMMSEGDKPDYFYVIKDGAAAVSRRVGGKETVIATLGEGHSFGEDALLANTVRNATVTMVKPGRLMRLAKAAFDDVMKPPAVAWLTPAKASIMVRQGAQVLDVRMPEEFAQGAIKGAVNAPLYVLREDAAAKLNKKNKVVVYCNTGERSAAAAFILSKIGFDAYALQGGLSSLLKVMAAESGAAG
jgi:CRP-like cAMP-binding protein